MSRKFALRVPAKCYDLSSKEVRRSIDEQITDYSRRFLATDNKRPEGTYLRMMLFQDRPDSEPYLYVYWRPIKESPPSHQEVLFDIEKAGRIPGEINTQRGHFFSLPEEALNNSDLKKDDLEDPFEDVEIYD